MEVQLILRLRLFSLQTFTSRCGMKGSKTAQRYRQVKISSHASHPAACPRTRLRDMPKGGKPYSTDVFVVHFL